MYGCHWFRVMWRSGWVVWRIRVWDFKSGSRGRLVRFGLMGVGNRFSSCGLKLKLELRFGVVMWRLVVVDIVQLCTRKVYRRGLSSWVDVCWNCTIFFVL
ncbi:hypothetical protein M758_3G003100 [Ceratodon purpureus]|nr:hypothetical protein M758_3G003100 [Ceratodon purpureus]